MQARIGTQELRTTVGSFLIGNLRKAIKQVKRVVRPVRVQDNTVVYGSSRKRFRQNLALLILINARNVLRVTSPQEDYTLPSKRTAMPASWRNCLACAMVYSRK